MTPKPSSIVTLSGRFAHKLKTPETLLEAIGPRPREKTVIMCHGVFDVVHPGHLRHLLYAKGQADILVASLTADLHITKAEHRPHIPQDLRALNLAAMEMVDYVIIDPNPTPLANIDFIRPDFFAKGYEYFTNGTGPKTRDEMDMVQSYGGEIIFTPGDVVYSSSKFITESPPAIRLDKLVTLMEKSGLTFDSLRNALDKFAGKRVHVVGDAIVDSYTNCSMIGGQTKTPTMSVLFESRTDFVGGAGIVADHLRAAGASVVFSTVLGDDELGRMVTSRLQTAGVDVRPIIDKRRPTTQKNAIVAGGYRLLKVDTLDNTTISDPILARLAGAVRSIECDGVVFSDFRHGMFNRRTIPVLTAAIPANVFRAADSQVASRWGNIIEFKGFDLITPNEREARFALGDQDIGIRPLASQIYDSAECKLLILKLGERGVLTVSDPNHESPTSFFVIDSFVDRLVDAVGAGDALLAYATLAMMATGSDVIATILGSIAAACECECDGNVPITPMDVRDKLNKVEGQLRYDES